MASYSHPELRVSSRNEEPKGEVLGKPIAPRVHTLFVHTGDTDIDRVVDDVLMAAESAGWRLGSDDPAAGVTGVLSWGGRKELDPGLAVISIGLDQEAEPAEVIIILEFAEGET